MTMQSAALGGQTKRLRGFAMKESKAFSSALSGIRYQRVDIEGRDLSRRL